MPFSIVWQIWSLHWCWVQLLPFFMCVSWEQDRVSGSNWTRRSDKQVYFFIYLMQTVRLSLPNSCAVNCRDQESFAYHAMSMKNDVTHNGWLADVSISHLICFHCRRWDQMISNTFHKPVGFGHMTKSETASHAKHILCLHSKTCPLLLRHVDNKTYNPHSLWLRPELERGHWPRHEEDCQVATSWIM